MSTLTPAAILYNPAGTAPLLVTSDNRLVTSAVSEPPAGKTAVQQSAVGDVNGGAPPVYLNLFYTIPNAASLTIARFAGGAEVDPAGSKVSLWWAPNGDETGLVLIRVGYASGNNFEFTLDWRAPFAGNGTRAILLRRERLAGGIVEVAGFWDGYY